MLDRRPAAATGPRWSPSPSPQAARTSPSGLSGPSGSPRRCPLQVAPAGPGGVRARWPPPAAYACTESRSPRRMASRRTPPPAPPCRGSGPRTRARPRTRSSSPREETVRLQPRHRLRDLERTPRSRHRAEPVPHRPPSATAPPVGRVCRRDPAGPAPRSTVPSSARHRAPEHDTAVHVRRPRRGPPPPRPGTSAAWNPVIRSVSERTDRSSSRVARSAGAGPDGSAGAGSAGSTGSSSGPAPVPEPVPPPPPPPPQPPRATGPPATARDRGRSVERLIGFFMEGFMEGFMECLIECVTGNSCRMPHPGVSSDISSWSSSGSSSGVPP